MKKILWLLAIVSMAGATGCTYYNPYNSSARTRFTGGVTDPGVHYNPWNDYSRAQVFPGTITTYTGRVVPVGGAFTWGGYQWAPTNGVYYPYSAVTTTTVQVDTALTGAQVRRIDMLTDVEKKKQLIDLLGSRKYGQARKAVAKDLNELGGLSAASAEFMGFKPNTTVEHVPTTSAPLAGTNGAERHSRQPNQQPAVFSVGDGRALATVATSQRIDAMRSDSVSVPTSSADSVGMSASTATVSAKPLADAWWAAITALQRTDSTDSDAVVAARKEVVAKALAWYRFIETNPPANPNGQVYLGMVAEKTVEQLNKYGLNDDNWFLPAFNYAITEAGRP